MPPASFQHSRDFVIAAYSECSGTQSSGPKSSLFNHSGGDGQAPGTSGLVPKTGLVPSCLRIIYLSHLSHTLLCTLNISRLCGSSLQWASGHLQHQSLCSGQDCSSHWTGFVDRPFPHCELRPGPLCLFWTLWRQFRKLH